MTAVRLATVWLSGCSGCHMSLLNLHGRLLELLQNCRLVYSPLADVKEYPEGVNIALVEGAVGNEENLAMARLIRERTKVVASLGDCAVNANVAGLRNPPGLETALKMAYGPSRSSGDAWSKDVPRLLPSVLPLHQVIRVDAFIPGCPPLPEETGQAVQRLAHRLQM